MLKEIGFEVTVKPLLLTPQHSTMHNVESHTTVVAISIQHPHKFRARKEKELLADPTVSETLLDSRPGGPTID